MKNSFNLFLITAGICLAATSPAGAADALPRSTPEAEGVLSAGLLDFVRAADERVNEMHSFMMLRHGKVVAEGWWTPYSAQSPHVLYSLSKSFTSTAVGLAIHEGKLSLDDEVLKFFPEDAPAESSNNLKSMRLRDLLSMSTGQQTEPSVSSKSEPWTKTFLAHTVPFKPGTHFLYNTPATYMQSAIVQKVTGMTVLDYLTPRLFEPLGIEKPRWDNSPQGVSLGGYGLNLRTEDIAKFGQLLLQKGQWHGKQLVPSGWIEMATSKQTSNGSNPKSDWDQGYGFQFWRSRNGAYRGDGAFGQYCIVLPAQEAVIAITSGTKDMQQVLNLVWDKILPAFRPDALAPDLTEQGKLKQALGSMALRTPEGKAVSGSPPSGLGKVFVFPENPQKLESITLQPAAGSHSGVLSYRQNGVDQVIVCGFKDWIKGGLNRPASPTQPVAASGAWVSDDTFKARLAFYEAPDCLNITLKFNEGKLSYEAEYNVAFGPTKLAPLTGEMK